MKKIYHKVNLEAGALKQKKAPYRIINRIPIKQVALIIILNLSIANFGYAQGDDTLLNLNADAESNQTYDRTGDCCHEENTADPSLKKTIWIEMPSTKMLMRSDREITLNMIHSLHMNRLLTMSRILSLSDQEVQSSFVRETTLSRSEIEVSLKADADIHDLFNAENISMSNANSIRESDRHIHSLFHSENSAVHISKDQALVSDAEIDMLFVMDNTVLKISANVMKAGDEEIIRNMDLEGIADMRSNSAHRN